MNYIYNQSGHTTRTRTYIPSNPTISPIPSYNFSSLDFLSLMHQVLSTQKTDDVQITTRFDDLACRLSANFTQLHNKFDALGSRIQVFTDKSASTSKSQESALAIALWSGHQLPPQTAPPHVSEDNNDLDGEDLREPPTPAQPPNHSVEQPDPAPDHTTRIDDRVDTLVSPPLIDKPEGEKQKERQFIPPPYKPPLPFPRRFRKELLEKYKALFEKQMQELELRMPLMDAFTLIPPYQKFLKDVVMERIKQVQGMVILNHECSAIIQRTTTPKKLSDPGSFTLPCLIGSLTFGRCLCDLGASVSLMPLTVAKRLGFEKFKPTDIQLVLADRTTRLPRGVLEDLSVKVGSVDVPTDFVVLEMEVELRDPFILG
ncbi:PREDICTED: uncharacterized protein LOC104744020 [Camelina sativa]|uniref:Uncharacterized protein LOC104744020 n=1 Tax=Camelina sativa TaxID=90675 RepID=A0ABM0VZ08_CAMSA|nr:PREDICTED: uncharacterized protein LOC104744020 [Camelina sativa]